MKFKSVFGLFSILIICCLNSIVYAEHSFISEACCTSNKLKDGVPEFPLPPKKKFRHHRNILLSTLFKPHHLIHDLILQEQDTVLVHAKFDYDWVLHKDLEDEYVHAYFLANRATQWVYLGKYKTNSNGEVFIPLTQKLKVGNYQIRMVVEGDRSIVDGLVSINKPGREAIVFDIDGTLTVSDFELVKDYLSLATALPYYYAAEVLDSYRNKGYQLIFLTARPYWMTAVSREWLQTVLFSEPWPLKTRSSILSPEGTARFKGNYLKHLIHEKKLKIIRAYGNALTDIEAYRLAGLPAKDIYIIGPNAGTQGTNAIKNDYFDHYYEVVVPTLLGRAVSNNEGLS